MQTGKFYLSILSTLAVQIQNCLYGKNQQANFSFLS